MSERTSQSYMGHALLRVGLFLGIVYGYLGTLENVWQWLGFWLIAEGADFAVRVVRQWEREDRTGRRG